MRIYLRGGLYYCDAREEGFGRFSTGETDPKKANITAMKLIVEKQGKPKSTKVTTLHGHGLTLAQAFNRAMDNHWRDHAKPKSKEANNMYAIKYFGGVKLLVSFKQEEIVAFKDWLRTQLKVNTISTFNKKVLALSLLLKLAREGMGMAAISALNRK